MEDDKLKNIWKKATGFPEKSKYTLAEIASYKQKKARDTNRNIRRGILVDIGYKAVIILGLIVHLFLQGTKDSQVFWIIGGLILLTVVLVGINLQFIRRLDQLTESNSILENLQQKIAYLRTTYRPFLFLSPLSNFLFILTGFFFYYHFKYGAIQMDPPWEDPVLYGFLILGYLIGFWAALPFYRMHLRELEECLEDLDDQFMAGLKIREHQRRKLLYYIIGATLLLVGIVVFLIVLYQSRN